MNFPHVLLAALLVVIGSFAPAALRAAPAAEFALRADDTVALVGGANIERMRFHGFLQTQLVAARPDSRVRVRNFGWEGDTVFEQWRDSGNIQNLDARRQAAERRIQQETGSTSWRQQRNWREQLGEAGVSDCPTHIRPAREDPGPR